MFSFSSSFIQKAGALSLNINRGSWLRFQQMLVREEATLKLRDGNTSEAANIYLKINESKEKKHCGFKQNTGLQVRCLQLLEQTLIP